MYKNTSGQKLRIFAFLSSNGVPQTGDAANITCKVSKDNGAPVDLADINPVEVEDGYYLFDVSKAETDADILDFYPESSTTNVVVIVPNFSRYTIRSPYLLYSSSGTGADNILLMTRVILGDMGPTYTYSDERIQQVMLGAALHLNMVATFENTYTIDLSSGISPDPAGDNDFIVLCSWKTACMISTYELKNHSGIMMRDGPSSLDTRGISNNKKVGMVSICKQFDDLLMTYLLSGGSENGGSGQAILGPYSPGSDMINWANETSRQMGWQ